MHCSYNKTNPLSPFSPGAPIRPSLPFSPGSPFIPGRPGMPLTPGRPGNPGSPASRGLNDNQVNFFRSSSNDRVQQLRVWESSLHRICKECGQRSTNPFRLGFLPNPVSLVFLVALGVCKKKIRKVNA